MVIEAIGTVVAQYPIIAALWIATALLHIRHIPRAVDRFVAACIHFGSVKRGAQRWFLIVMMLAIMVPTVLVIWPLMLLLDPKEYFTEYAPEDVVELARVMSLEDEEK